MQVEAGQVAHMPVHRTPTPVHQWARGPGPGRWVGHGWEARSGWWQEAMTCPISWCWRSCSSSPRRRLLSCTSLWMALSTSW